MIYEYATISADSSATNSNIMVVVKKKHKIIVEYEDPKPLKSKPKPIKKKPVNTTWQPRSLRTNPNQGFKPEVFKPNRIK